MNRSMVTFGLAVAVLAAAAGLQAQQPWSGIVRQQPIFGGPARGKPPALLRQFAGGGGWQSHGRRDRQGWDVQLKHFDDGSLSGRVVIVGSPVLDHAQIQGQVTGSDVDGVLLDDSGRQVGTFSGTIRNKRVSGTYTTADANLGSWEWDGALPN